MPQPEAEDGVQRRVGLLVRRTTRPYRAGWSPGTASCRRRCRAGESLAANRPAALRQVFLRGVEAAATRAIRRETSSPRSGRTYRTARSASRRVMSSLAPPVSRWTRMSGWRSWSVRSAGSTRICAERSVVATRSNPESVRSAPSARRSSGAPLPLHAGGAQPLGGLGEHVAVAACSNSLAPSSRSSARTRRPTVV